MLSFCNRSAALQCRRQLLARPPLSLSRSVPSSPYIIQAGSATRTKSSQCSQQTPCSNKSENSKPRAPSITESAFWVSRPTWRRAGVNTLRCLVGCTLGDFSTMWYLQAFHSDMAMGSIMAISMASGISTSLMLETLLLRFGRDALAWGAAARTAAGMSMISMITMEIAENAVDYNLTGGVVQVDSPAFWMAALLSILAGFLAPLPYNYIRLRRYGKACH